MYESRPSESLLLSRQAIRFLIGLNLLLGLLIALLFVISFFELPLLEMLGFDDAENHQHLMALGRTVMVLGLAGVGLAHFVLKQLQAIVATVHAGDPFVAENAGRVQGIAWSVLVWEVLRYAVHVVAPFEHPWEFPFAHLLTVLLLFVLARVFEQGAHMREDLEGTV